MEEYRKKTSVVYDYYKVLHKSHTIDGFGSVDEIFEM
jgi:adenylate kinase family enzyme